MSLGDEKEHFFQIWKYGVVCCSGRSTAVASLLKSPLREQNQGNAKQTLPIY